MPRRDQIRPDEVEFYLDCHRRLDEYGSMQWGDVAQALGFLLANMERQGLYKPNYHLVFAFEVGLTAASLEPVDLTIALFT